MRAANKDAKERKAPKKAPVPGEAASSEKIISDE